MTRNILVIFLLFALSSCLSFYDLKGSSKTLMPVAQEVYDNKVKENYKVGISCATNILLLFASGDSSIEAAKNKGNIEKVSSVSTTYEHFILYFPFYQKGCTVVTGE